VKNSSCLPWNKHPDSVQVIFLFGHLILWSLKLPIVVINMQSGHVFGIEPVIFLANKFGINLTISLQQGHSFVSSRKFLV
jgi:hypothetical protein